MVNHGGRIYECWFLDVGQGLSNIIYLGDNQAIVIDCGPTSSNTTIEFLRKHVDNIEALIISHNHSDHDGNTAKILSEYPQAINNIYLIDDGELDFPKMYSVLMNDKDNKKYPKPIRIESRGSNPNIIYKKGRIELSILYPDMMSNKLSEKYGKRRPNVTSCIMRLKIGRKKIFYSSDATIEAWDSLKGQTEKLPLKCDIMTIPHHGGYISADEANEIEYQKSLYSSIIVPQFGIISVGTSNTNSHPRKETIDVLKENNVKILCTQITNKCCGQLEDIRKIPRILTQPTSSKRDEDKTAAGNSRNVACFGTIIVEVDGDTIKFPKYITQHLEAFRDIPTYRLLCG